MSKPYTTLKVHLQPDELEMVERAAKTLGMPVSGWLKAAALRAARGQPRRHYTSRELIGIHARALAAGHLWTEAELRERKLPLYWCDDWRKDKLEQGLSYSEMAMLCGVSKRSLIAYIRRHEGVTQQIRDDSTATQARRLVEGGLSRVEAAAEMGVSYALVARYTSDLISDQGRDLTRRLDTAGPYPATVQQLAERIFGHDAQRAAKWGHEMVRAGYLRRVARATYERTGTMPG